MFTKGFIPWIKGKKHSPETRRKMSVARVGKRFKPFTDEHKRNLSESISGFKHTKEARIKMSIARRGVSPWNKGKKSWVSGDKHYKWRGGITPINKAIRNSLQMRLVRRACFERDNYTCVWCGLRSMKGVKAILHADHIKPFAYYPELRFALDNLRTLCVDCHKKTNTWGESVKHNKK